MRCSGVTGALVFGNNVTSIGERAFEETSISNVTLGTSVSTVGSEAFNQCPNMNSVSIPTSITSIGNNAFAGCKQPFSFSYQGTKDAWNAKKTTLSAHSWSAYTRATKIMCTDGETNLT